MVWHNFNYVIPPQTTAEKTLKRKIRAVLEINYKPPNYSQNQREPIITCFGSVVILSTRKGGSSKCQIKLFGNDKCVS